MASGGIWGRETTVRQRSMCGSRSSRRDITHGGSTQQSIYGSAYTDPSGLLKNPAIFNIHIERWVKIELLQLK